MATLLNTRELQLAAIANVLTTGSLVVTASNSSFILPKDSALATPTSISLTATASSVYDGTATYLWQTSNDTAPNTWNTYTAASTTTSISIISTGTSPTSLSTLIGEGRKLFVRCTITQPTRGTANDTYTIDFIKEATDGYTIENTRASVALISNTTGTVSNYANSSTVIRVLQGNTPLTYVSSNPTAAGQFTIGTVTQSPANSITVGTILGNNTTAATVSAHSAFVSDSVVLTYPITIRGYSTTSTVTTSQSIVKVRPGGAAVYAYKVISSPSLPVSPTIGLNVTPTAGNAVLSTAIDTFGGWYSTPASSLSGSEWMFQVSGTKTETALGTIYDWVNPSYLSTFRVGTLSALAVDTGDLTVSGTLTLGTAGKIVTQGGGYTSGGVFLGYEAGAYRFSIGSAASALSFNGTQLIVPAGQLSGSIPTGVVVPADTITGQITNAVTGLSSWANTNISLTGNTGVITLSGASPTNFTASGVLMPGNPITAGNISNYINSGVITNDFIAANTITTKNLAIGDFTNLAKNWSFEEGDTQWNKEPGWTIVSGTGEQRGVTSSVNQWVARRIPVAGTPTSALRAATIIPITPGESFYAECWIKHSAGSTPSVNSARIRLIAIDQNFGLVTAFNGSTVLASTTSYTKSIVTATVTSSSAVGIYVDIASDITSGTCFADEVKFIRASNSVLIADGAIVAEKIGVGAVSATAIASNAVTADKISAGAVVASKILITDLSNIVKNPDFLNGNTDGLTLGLNGAIVSSTSAGVPSGAPTAWVFRRPTPPSVVADLAVTDWIPVSPGDTYYFQASIVADSGTNSTITPHIRIGRTSTNDLNFSTFGAAGTSTSLSAGSFTTWTNYNTIFTVPATFTAASDSGTPSYMRLGIRSNVNSTGAWNITRIVLRRASSGELIVDGAITANKIAAETITGDKIAANTIASKNLIVADFSNLVKNWNFEEGDTQWNEDTAGWEIVNNTSQQLSGTWVARRTRSLDAVNASVIRSAFIPASSAESFYAEAWIKHGAGSTGTGSYVRIMGFSSNGVTELESSNGNVITAATTTYTKSTASITLSNANTKFIRVEVISDLTGGITYVDEVKGIRRASSNLIVDGAITALKLSVTSLSAITASTGSLSVDGTLSIGPTGAIQNTGGGYTSSGVFLGYSGGNYRFSIGNPTNGFLTYDGNTLSIPAARITGTVTAGQIAAGAITTQKLLVAPPSLCPSPYFEDEAWWTATLLDSSGWTFETGTTFTVPKRANLVAGIGTLRKHIWSGDIASPPAGTNLRLKARFENFTNQWIDVAARFYNSAGVSLGGDITVRSASNTGVLSLTTIGTVPSNAATIRFIVYNQSAIDGGTALTGTVSVSGIQLDLATTGELVVDGSITAGKINASGLTIRNQDNTIILNASGASTKPWVQLLSSTATNGLSLADPLTGLVDNVAYLYNIAAGPGVDINLANNVYTFKESTPTYSRSLTSDTTVNTSTTRPNGFNIPLEANTTYIVECTFRVQSNINQLDPGTYPTDFLYFGIETPSGTTSTGAQSTFSLSGLSVTKYSNTGGGDVAGYGAGAPVLKHTLYGGGNTYDSGAWGIIKLDAVVKTRTVTGIFQPIFQRTTNVTGTIGAGSTIVVKRIDGTSQNFSSTSLTGTANGGIASSYTASRATSYVGALASITITFLTDGTWSVRRVGNTTLTGTGTWLATATADFWDIQYVTTAVSTGEATISNAATNYTQILSNIAYTASVYAFNESFSDLVSVSINLRNRLNGTVTTWSTQLSLTASSASNPYI